MLLAVAGGEAPSGIAGDGLQFLKLLLGEIGEKNGVVLGILAIPGGDKPFSLFQVYIFPRYSPWRDNWTPLTFNERRVFLKSPP